MGDGDDVQYVSHRMIDPERQKIFATAFPACCEGSTVVLIVAKTTSGDMKELTAVITAGRAEFITACCSITYEDLTPSECIEYAFPEAPERWSMCQLSTDAL